MSRPESYRFKYTTAQIAAIRDTLKQAGFADKAQWPTILKEITQIARNAKIQQDRDTLNPLQYCGTIEKQVLRFVKGLAEAVTALKSMPVEMQFHFSSFPIEGIDPELVASLRESERSALRKLLDPTRFPRLLAAFAQQATAPRLLNNVPKTGAPKDHALREAVTELWNVYAYATGQEPKVYPSAYGKNREAFSGGFYEFAKAVVGPTLVTDRKTLGSKIHVAYQEWRKLMRPSSRRPNIKTHRR